MTASRLHQIPGQVPVGVPRMLYRRYEQGLRRLVMALAACAGLGVMTMMAVTTADIVLRALGRPLVGAFDIVRMAGGVTVACGLPYTTAVKGHVAVEFLFRRLGRRQRVMVDALARLAVMVLLAVLARRLAAFGFSLYASGQVTGTLQIPVFWLAYVLAASCAVTVLVVLHNLCHPGKETIKP